MTDRLLDVSAFTTLDVADGHAIGQDWQDDAAAVVDVDPSESGGTVELSIELDPFGLEHLDGHFERVSLTPQQARRLATALEDAAFDAEPNVGTFDKPH